MTKNEFLNIDGSVTNLSGTLVLPADEKRAELYKTMSPIKNELLNADGSTTTFSSGNSEVGEITSSLTALKISTQNIVSNERTLILWDKVVLNDVDNNIFKINAENNSILFNKDLKRLEILLQLTSNAPSDMVNMSWYTHLRHIKSSGGDIEKEYGQKATNYFQSKFVIHNIKVNDELCFEMTCNKDVTLLTDSKFTYVDFVAVL